MVEPNGRNLVFLLSTPRAGSTLLGAILGNHSQVFCPNEPWLLLGLKALQDERSRDRCWSNEHLAAIALRDLLSQSQFAQACRAFALSAYNQKLQQSAKSIFIDKTPRYGQILSFLDELFPESRKIWLQRNPLDVAVSYAQTWKILTPELIGENFTINSLDLTLGLANYLEYFHGQKNAFEIRYEDLVANAQPAIHAICKFLGISPEPNLENYGASDDSLQEMKNQLMGDKNIFAHSSPHTDSVDKWKQALAHTDIQKIIDAIGPRPFERMGYSKTIDDLQSMGFHFPSESDVNDRMSLLRKKAKMGIEEAAPADPPQSPSHWWIRLGHRLGIPDLPQ